MTIAIETGTVPGSEREPRLTNGGERPMIYTCEDPKVKLGRRADSFAQLTVTTVARSSRMMKGGARTASDGRL